MISRTFTKEKETKGTVMYREDTNSDERGWIGTIYILKDKLPKPFPNNITVSVSFNEE